MNHTYRIAHFQDESGERMSAIYCADLGEMAIETRGDILPTEQYDLEAIVAETPWEGAEDLSFAHDWREMTEADYDALSSEGLRQWINSKV